MPSVLFPMSDLMGCHGNPQVLNVKALSNVVEEKMFNVEDIVRY